MSWPDPGLTQELSGDLIPFIVSRTAHWAFDVGMFTISDQYEVIVHPKAKNASTNKFLILNMHGMQINLPEDENYYPHPEAIEWHNKEVFDRFTI